MGLCSLNHHSTIIGPDKTFVAIRTYLFLPTFFFSRWWYFSGAERLVSADKFMFTCTLDTIAVTLSQTGCEHGILCITAQYCRQTSSCGPKQDQTWTKTRQSLRVSRRLVFWWPLFSWFWWRPESGDANLIPLVQKEARPHIAQFRCNNLLLTKWRRHDSPSESKLWRIIKRGLTPVGSKLVPCALSLVFWMQTVPWVES